MASIIASDEFSELPYDIRQRILSSLNLKQRAIASLVSTKWHHTITSLNDSKFVQKHPTNRYCGYCYQYSRLEFFNKCSTLHPVIKLAADNTTLTEFYFFVSTSFSFFLLSPSIFVSPTLLTVLHLKYCTIKGENFDDINDLPSLKEIYFDQVEISSTTFSNLINKCPSIVELTLIDCLYLLSISVPHLNQLKKVHIHVNYDRGFIPTIQIKAQNLREFYLFTSSSSSKLDLCACTKLQVLKIDCEYIPDGFPPEISSSFPCLKSLFLRLCKRLKRLALLSPELENLTLIDMVHLDDATIVTPNLRSFKIIAMGKVPRSSPEVGSRLMEADIGLKYVYATNRLPALRTFTRNLGENLTLSLAIGRTKEVLVDMGNHGSKDIQPLCIKHINLEITFSWIPRYKSLIDELLRYFHPKTLLVRVNPNALKQPFVQVFLNELKRREICDEWSKYLNNYMHWCYFLKDFKILESTTRQDAHQIISLEFQWY